MFSPEGRIEVHKGQVEAPCLGLNMDQATSISPKGRIDAPCNKNQATSFSLKGCVESNFVQNGIVIPGFP